MEYTDAPSVETRTETDTMQCPLCGHTLPADAERCDRCDWVPQGKSEMAEGKASDAVAVLLSVIPGLGHIYKGHNMIGLMLIFVGTPMAVGLAALVATATAGFGLGLLPIYWFGVMFHVYGIQDRVEPGANAQGEEY